MNKLPPIPEGCSPSALDSSNYHLEMPKPDEKASKVLPLLYKDPLEKDVFWICDYDEDKKITSVFFGHDERYSAYMDSEADAQRQEEMLKESGWVKCKKPEVTMSFENKHGSARKLKRKQERMAENEKKREEKKRRDIE